MGCSGRAINHVVNDVTTGYSDAECIAPYNYLNAYTQDRIGKVSIHRNKSC